MRTMISYQDIDNAIFLDVQLPLEQQNNSEITARYQRRYQRDNSSGSAAVPAAFPGRRHPHPDSPSPPPGAERLGEVGEPPAHAHLPPERPPWRAAVRGLPPLRVG